MLKFILDISLKNRLLVLICTVILMCSGLYVIRSMDIDVFPDLTAPTVTIITEAHGMEAEEVERLVTYKVETGLNGSPNVRRIRSSSQAGISTVWVEFDWDTEIYRARQIISEKLPQIKGKLPKGVGEPEMTPISSIMGEIMLVAVTSDTIDGNTVIDPMEMRTTCDWIIQPQLKAVEGVANVIVVGGEYKQYQIHAIPTKLDHYGITLDDLIIAAESCGENSTGGILNRHGNQYTIKGEGRAYSVDQIANRLVKKIGEVPVKIGDVANVVVGAKDKVGDGSKNAQKSVLLVVVKQPDANTIELSDRIDKVVDNLSESLPEGLVVDNHVFRQSDFIENSVNNLQRTLLEGALFVLIVLFIFLMNWRTTVISLLAIPISLVVSFIVLKLLGYTINTMSLGGMAIAIGALVDDAIIDVENVYKRLRENLLKPDSEKLSVRKVVFKASIEIRSSIIIATLIIIVAFVPLFFLGGMEGRLLKPLGIAFITAVTTSLIVAVTVTPVLCSYLLKREKLLRKHASGTWLERKLTVLYSRVLNRFLSIPKLTIAFTILVFGVSIWYATGLGRSFLPPFNEGALVLITTGPPSMSLEESNKVGNAIEKIVLSMPEVNIVTRRTGRGELDEHGQGVNGSELEVPFVLKDRSKAEFMAALREKLEPIKGVSIVVGLPMGHRIDHMISGTRANIAVKIYGGDLSKLFSIGKEAQYIMNRIHGITDVSLEQQIEVPQIKIVPREEQMAMHGLSMKDFNEFIDVAFAGEKMGEIYEDQKSFDLIVRYDTSYRNSIDKLKSALINLPNGRMIALEQVADVKSWSSPHTINKENAERKVVVSANLSDGDMKSIITKLQNNINSGIKLPDGYRIEYGGQFENEEKASRLLLFTSIAATLIIFLLLYLEFKDLRLSSIVLINLPMALIGGIFMVHFTTGIISIASTIGFISLFGIATRNGILLVSRYQALKEEGYNLRDRIFTGSVDRLNPILMTALTTALALIPIAVNGTEPGNEIQSPMALVILGGLLTATLLNVIVIPCVYQLMAERKK